MLDAGRVVIQSESFAANVIPLARADRTAFLEDLETNRQRIVLTDLGRRLAPEAPPFPWRPNIGGTGDITLCEVERQRKIAAYTLVSRQKRAPASISGEIRGGLIVAAFGRRST